MYTVDFSKYPFVYNGTALKSFASRGLKEKYLVKNAPLSQVPFLIYFGHDIEEDSIRKDINYGLWETFSISQVLQMIKDDRNHNCLRDLIEMFSSFTPVGADILMQADMKGFTKDNLPKNNGLSVLSSFHSYNRKYVKDILDEMGNSTATKSKCLLLPCSAHRPYNTSKTHQEIYNMIPNIDDYYKVVVTTIGPVPEEYWQHPFILSYTNSYPDL